MRESIAMSVNFHKHLQTFWLSLAGALIIAILQTPFVFAATPNSLYSYDLKNVTGASVPNGAAVNTAVNLNLFGDWTPGTNGVAFAGNLVDQQSVGYAKPATGYTVNLTASQPLAFGAAFTYQAPASASCFSDSPNVVQVGRAGDYIGQAKMQLSNCGKNASAVFVQCRFAGASTPVTVKPVTSTLALQDGYSYTATCQKTGSGTTTSVSMSVTKIDTINGNQTVTNTFPIADTGLVRTSAYLSVANKYPLASQANNTDQFVGTISKVAYCTGPTAADANNCLNTELPL